MPALLGSTQRLINDLNVLIEPRRRLRVLIALVAVGAALTASDEAAADRTVFVTNSDSPSTGLAAFNARLGSLSMLPGSPVATGEEPTGVTVSPDARHAYVANLNDDAVGIFRLGVDGKPTSRGVAPVGGNQPSGLTMTPDGAFLLTGNRDSTDTAPSVSVLEVNRQNGSLSAVASSPENLGIFDPRAVAVSPDGRFIYVTGRRGPLGPPPSNADQAIAVAAIGDDGNLTPITGSPFFTPGFFNVAGASIAPDGSRLFVVEANQDKLEVFDLNQSTGAPTPVLNSPFAAGADAPLMLSVAPDGARLYVAETFGTAVEGFDIAAASGALTQIAGTPFTVNGQPEAVAITPDGSRVFSSILSNPGQVEGLRAAASGSLSRLTGSPFASGGVFPSFFSVAVTPTQTPDVAFEADPGKPGQPTHFDARATTVRGGLPTRFDWDFGDGTTLADGGPTPAHTYAEPDVFEVKLTVTNDCDPDAVFQGQVVSVGNAVYCNGSRDATLTQQVDAIVDGSVSAKKTQRQRGRKIVVKAKVKANEELTADAGGEVKLGGKSYNLKPKDAQVGTDQKKLKLKPKRRKDRKRIAGALDDGRTAKAKLDVTLTDTAGNSLADRVRVKLEG